MSCRSAALPIDLVALHNDLIVSKIAPIAHQQLESDGRTLLFDERNLHHLAAYLWLMHLNPLFVIARYF